MQRMKYQTRGRRTRLAAIPIVLAGIAFCLATIWIGQSRGAAPPTAVSYYEKALFARQIEPDAAGLRTYLVALHPGDAQRERAKRLIQQLGDSDSFAKRELATSRLLVLPQLPTKALIAATTGPDPEIRWRAKKILELGKPESGRILFAAFKTISQKRIGGLTAELLRAIPLCDKKYLRSAARQAVQSTAHPKNAATLRRGLKSKNVDVRIAAAGGLGKALGKRSAADLNPLLDDPQDRIKLAAARAIERVSSVVLAGIEWPNDVVIAGKKVAGVLCEAVRGSSADVSEVVVVGMGINVRTPVGGFAIDIRTRATSLQESVEAPVSRAALAGALVGELRQATQHGGVN